MTNHHHSLLHFLRLDDEMHEMYASRALRAFAFSLVDIFIPVYLLGLGYPLSDVVLKYLIVFFISLAVSSPLAALLESRIGIKHTVLIGSALLLAFFGMLFTMDSYRWPLTVVSAIGGVQAALYWLPFNSSFARCSRKEELGREVGYSEMFPYLAAVAAPLMGAWIITSLGFQALLIAVAFFVALSVAVLFATPEKRAPLRFAWGKVLGSRENSGFFAMFFCKGALLGAAAVWPIFIYFLSKEYMVIGGTATFAGIGAGLFSFAVGVASDRISRRKILAMGALLGFAAWLAATQVGDMTALLAVALALSTAMIAIDVPTFAATCERAKRMPTSEFMVFREFGLLAGRLFALVPLLAALDIRIAFVGAAFLSLGFLFFKIS